MHQLIAFDHVSGLYRTYADDLDRVREKQRKLLAPPVSMKAQLDDIEEEITYLLLREAGPETVVEIGTFHGWSTTWLLRALHGNSNSTGTGTGHLYSYDITDNVTRSVPKHLSAGRWTFTQGDALLEAVPGPGAPPPGGHTRPRFRPRAYLSDRPSRIDPRTAGALRVRSPRTGCRCPR